MFSRNEVIRQLRYANVYRAYNWNQIRFANSKAHEVYGLHYAIIPGKHTHWNALIPYIISPDTCLVNLCYFNGESDVDTTRLTIALSKVLISLKKSPTKFYQADIDSIRKLFIYGGSVEPKAGYFPH